MSKRLLEEEEAEQGLQREEGAQDVREEEDGESGRDFSQLRVQGQLCEGGS